MILADLGTNDALIVAAIVSALPGLTAVILGYLNHRQIRTPSGETLGAIAERTHHLSETTSVAITKVLNGQTQEAKGNDQHDA